MECLTWKSVKVKKKRVGKSVKRRSCPIGQGKSVERAGRHDELPLAGKVKFKLEDVRCERWSGLAEESLLPCGHVVPALGKH